jgi:hypothetical protein
VVTQPLHATLTGAAPNLAYTPSANYNGQDSFTFKANDGTADSNVAQVSITVSPVNDPPKANAGPNQTVNENTPVILDGSSSSDPDGDSLTYNWKQTAGPSVTLSNAQAVKPIFTAPEIASTTTLSFELTVSDEALSSTDAVDITVNKKKEEEPPPKKRPPGDDDRRR